MFIDSFSGGLMNLPKKERTEENVLSLLKDDPLVSMWDMTEKWIGQQHVYEMLYILEDKGLIIQVDQAFPWHRWEVVTPV